MYTDDRPDPTPTGRHQALASRLLLLAADSDRVGLRREAEMLVAVASCVLNGHETDVNVDV